MAGLMNIFDKSRGKGDGEARVRYLAGEFQVLSPGDFVRCAVTARPIPIASLKYWSVERQEAYADIETSVRRSMKKYRPV